MDRRVLIVAENDTQKKELSLSLRQSGLDALAVVASPEVLKDFYKFRPSLLLIDFDAPDFDGWDLCSRVRELADTPIVVMSEESTREALLKGYDIGVDGYIIKPASSSEVIQRVFGALRRRPEAQGALEVPAPFDCDGLSIDWARNEVRANGSKLTLTPTEYRLLGYLAQNRGRIMTHEQILSRVWGPEYAGERSYVKLYIRYLREKIEQDPSKPQLIVTERGFGYRFAA